jgi:hypothetical protein
MLPEPDVDGRYPERRDEFPLGALAEIVERGQPGWGRGLSSNSTVAMNRQASLQGVANGGLAQFFTRTSNTIEASAAPLLPYSAK